MTQEINAIKRRYLWCANFLSMNDPMEGYYRPSSRLKKKTEYDRVIDLLYTKKLQIGICCFSDTNENELDVDALCRQLFGHMRRIPDSEAG